MPVLTAATVIALVTSTKGKQLIGLLTSMLNSKGGVNDMIGESAGAWAQIIATNMQTDYRIVTQEKFSMLKLQLSDLAMEKVALACEIPDEQELFNSMLISYLLVVQERFDNPNK